MSPERGEAAGRRGSASEGPRCKGRKADGTPCGAPPEFVDPETGLCPSHQEGASERLREAGRRGAEATKRRYSGGGLDPEDLPPLRGPRDAEAWLAALAEGVVSGRVSKGLAGEARKLLKAWLSAHDAGEVSEKLERLETAIRESRKRGGDVTPILELVEGERDA